MAGIGQAPADVRRRRNEPARGEWVDLPPLEAPILPELPDRTDGEVWSERTKAAWAAWRADPVTQVYTPADLVYVLELALLFDGMTSSNANEVRYRMDGLGLTPKGKRDLRLRVQEKLAAAAPKAKASKKASGRRARLSVVK